MITTQISFIISKRLFKFTCMEKVLIILRGLPGAHESSNQRIVSYYTMNWGDSHM
jgi:hypothetical protein